MKLSDLLWDAANKSLSMGRGEWHDMARYSCIALQNHCHDMNLPFKSTTTALAIYKKLVGARNSEGFSDRKWVTFKTELPQETLQILRYDMMILASYIAEDKGIEV